MLGHGFFVCGSKNHSLGPRGSGFDPFDQSIDLFFGQWLAFAVRRHDVVVVMGQLDPQNDFRFLRILQKKSRTSISAFEHRLARAHV